MEDRRPASNVGKLIQLLIAGTESHELCVDPYKVTDIIVEITLVDR
jgi:hypothetical protein